jgi:hypothetical protein
MKYGNMGAGNMMSKQYITQKIQRCPFIHGYGTWDTAGRRWTAASRGLTADTTTPKNWYNHEHRTN